MKKELIMFYKKHNVKTRREKIKALCQILGINYNLYSNINKDEEIQVLNGLEFEFLYKQ